MLNFRRPRQPSYFGPSTILRLTGIDADANTLSGVVVGGPHNGTEVSDMGCEGSTKPAAFAAKGISHIDPADIEAGRAHLVVDGLRRTQGRFTSRWMRIAGPEVVCSTADEPRWMAVVPLTTSWPAANGEDPVRKIAVMTVETHASAVVRDMDSLSDTFTTLAGRDDGYGRVVVSAINSEGPEAGRATTTLYGPGRGEDGKPLASPAERFEAFLEQAGGRDTVAAHLEAGHALSLAGASMRLLSKYETSTLEDRGQLERFKAPTHGSRLVRALDRLDVPNARERVEQDFSAWGQGAVLEDATNKQVAAWAQTRGIELPRVGSRGFLPAAYSLTRPDEDGQPPALIKRIVCTAVPVPENYVPVAGDENAVSRYHDMYADVAETLATGQVLDAAVAADASAPVAAAPEPEVAATEAETRVPLDEARDVEDFSAEQLDDAEADELAAVLGLGSPGEGDGGLPAPGP